MRAALVVLVVLVALGAAVAVAPSAAATGGCFPHFHYETVYHPVTGEPVTKVPVYDGMVC